MASVNKAIIIGNVGRDPEVRHIPSGQQVASFSVATTERWNKDGQQQEKTEWHPVVAWGKLAELVAQYVKKGSRVYVEGKLSTKSWDDKDGSKRYKTEIIAQQVQFLSYSKERDTTLQESATAAPESYASQPSSAPAQPVDDLPF